MQMVYELQPKAGVEVGMAALRFIQNFLQKNDRSQSHDNLIDSILSGILVSSLNTSICKLQT